VIDLARRPSRFWLAALAAGVLALAFAPPGSAAGSSLLGGTCDAPMSKPFLRWLDPLTYTLAPDGGFEGGASGWTLSGGARVVSGNEPWRVAGSRDSFSLSLPAGARATSPEMCIGLLHPTVRLFARNTALLGLGALSVEAEVRVGGLHLFLPVGVVVAGSGFQPTLPLPLLANLTNPVTGDRATVRLRFTSVLGKFGIDDVFVDPFKLP
jgi:hypothetical protein